jgi:[ribosomal protein S5]-alanine N-acetyltransferase
MHGVLDDIAPIHFLKTEIFMEILLPVITERLLLDKFIPDDWKDFYLMEQSPEQHRFNFESYNPRTEDEIIKFIDEKSKQKYDKNQIPFLLAIRLKVSEKFIGFIGFNNGKLEKQGTIEIYFSLYKDYWNKGYGTEALKAMIEFGFTVFGLHRIWAGCDIDNIASKKVMEKAGMRLESRWRKDRLRNNKWTDGLGFAILSEDIM